MQNINIKASSNSSKGIGLSRTRMKMACRPIGLASPKRIIPVSWLLMDLFTGARNFP